MIEPATPMTSEISQIITRSAQQSMTIDDIVALLPANLYAVKDDRGYIADKSTMALICTRKHIHRYYVSSVCSALDLKCLTCSWGTKFIKMARETLEDTIGAPFIVTDDNNFKCVARNVIIMATLHKVSGIDSCESGVNPIHIHIYKTESRKKIVRSIMRFLGSHVVVPDTKPVKPRMRRQIRTRIYQLPVLYIDDYL